MDILVRRISVAVLMTKIHMALNTSIETNSKDQLSFESRPTRYVSLLSKTPHLLILLMMLMLFVIEVCTVER